MVASSSDMTTRRDPSRVASSHWDCHWGRTLGPARSQGRVVGHDHRERALRGHVLCRRPWRGAWAPARSETSRWTARSVCGSDWRYAKMARSVAKRRSGVTASKGPCSVNVTHTEAGDRVADRPVVSGLGYLNGPLRWREELFGDVDDDGVQRPRRRGNHHGQAGQGMEEGQAEPS